MVVYVCGVGRGVGGSMCVCDGGRGGGGCCVNICTAVGEEEKGERYFKSAIAVFNIVWNKRVQKGFFAETFPFFFFFFRSVK